MALPLKAEAQNCEVVYETISTLRKPDLGSFNLWDHVSGKLEKSEVIQSAILLPSSQVLVGIEQFMSEDSPKSLILQELDRRGRIVWRKNLDIKNVSSLEKIILWGQEIVVLANREVKGKKHIWIGFYTLDGTFIRQKSIQHKDHDYQVNDGVITLDNTRLLLSVVSEKRNKTVSPFTSLLWLDKRGNIQEDRAYMFGSENHITTITPHTHQGYILAGSISTEDGRRAGWVVSATEDGGINWQRQYARGNFAEFTDLSLAESETFIALVGEAFPAESGGRRSSWVMMADINTGDIAWQRFYREDFDIFSRSVMTEDDGQISIALSLEDSENQDLDFVRLIALNPRGVMLSSETYQHGAGARAKGMIFGSRSERIIYGDADVVYQIPEEPNNPENESFKDVTSQEAWVVAGSANDLYTDPCRRPKQSFE